MEFFLQACRFFSLFPLNKPLAHEWREVPADFFWKLARFAKRNVLLVTAIYFIYENIIFIYFSNSTIRTKVTYRTAFEDLSGQRVRHD